MKFEFVIQLWHVLVATVTIASAFAINTHMTRQNDKKIKTLEDTVTELEKNSNDMITKEEARKIFVSKEVNVEQMKHIDTSIGEIKEYQKEILEHLRK